MNKKVSAETNRELDRLVERVARKSGYNGGEMTYKEHIQKKFEDNIEKLHQKIKKYKNKLSLKPGNRDFTEEIKSYLNDGINELIENGMTEKEALKITLEKFDEAELQENFESFIKEFNGFGMEEYNMKTKEWYEKNGEAVGLIYGGFTTLGMTIGALIGYLSTHGIREALIGLAAGLFIGVSFAMIVNAVIMMKNKK